jgi:hypothetical protein
VVHGIKEKGKSLEDKALLLVTFPHSTSTCLILDKLSKIMKDMLALRKIADGHTLAVMWHTSMLIR